MILKRLLLPLRAPRKKLLRHKISGRQFGRASGPRRAMFRIMVTNLLRHGQIKTTVAKAKAIRPLTEKMVNLGKAGTLHDRRQAAAFITDKSVLKNEMAATLVSLVWVFDLVTLQKWP